MRVEEFDFALPPELIAQAPVYPRASAKLLHVPRQGEFADLSFGALGQVLRAGDLLVFNRSRVIPARLFGTRQRGESTAQIETTLTEKLDERTWASFSKPGKRIAVGDTIDYGSNLSAQVVGKQGPEIRLSFNKAGQDLVDAFDAVGSMPLPPYIKRERGGKAADLDDYQPFTAKDPGSVAAPTASLHFDASAVEALKRDVGIDVAEVTLHVGLGTFAPIRVEDTDDHIMHFERCAIDSQNAARIAAAKAQGRRIIAIGTTVLRTLESLAPSILAGQADEKRTDLFITPGFDFQIVDAMVTNFHLPKSTLLMLVCAFCGQSRMLDAYRHAVNHQYRFFSYGDGCFLERPAP